MTKGLTLVELTAHCGRLAELLSDPLIQSSRPGLSPIQSRGSLYWLDVAKVLELAAGVSRIHVEMACPGGANPSTQREIAVGYGWGSSTAGFLKQLAILDLIWKALEMGIVVVRPQSVAVDKVKAFSRFLKDWYVPDVPLQFCEDTLTQLRSCLAQNGALSVAEQQLQAKQDITCSRAGLHLVSRLWGDPNYGFKNLLSARNPGIHHSIQMEIIALSSRLVLFSLQYLALASLKRYPNKVGYDVEEDKGLWVLEAERSFRDLHVSDWPIASREAQAAKTC